MTNTSRRDSYTRTQPHTFPDTMYTNPRYPAYARNPKISKTEIMLTRLAGIPIILAGYFSSRLVGEGTCLLFALIIGIAALAYNPYPKHRRPCNSPYRGRTVRLTKGVR